jgi:hypothetical protein
MDDAVYNPQLVTEPTEKKTFLNKFTITADGDDEESGQSKVENGLTTLGKTTNSSNYS